MSKKSDCKFKKKINAYLDNELKEAEFIQVKHHLLNCSICQAEVREISQLNKFLDSFQEDEVPGSLSNNILAAVSEVSETFPVRKNRFFKYTAAAAIAASFIIGLLFSFFLSKLHYRI